MIQQTSLIQQLQIEGDNLIQKIRNCSQLNLKKKSDKIITQKETLIKELQVKKSKIKTKCRAYFTEIQLRKINLVFDQKDFIDINKLIFIHLLYDTNSKVFYYVDQIQFFQNNNLIWQQQLTSYIINVDSFKNKAILMLNNNTINEVLIANNKINMNQIYSNKNLNQKLFKILKEKYLIFIQNETYLCIFDIQEKIILKQYEFISQETFQFEWIHLSQKSKNSVNILFHGQQILLAQIFFPNLGIKIRQLEINLDSQEKYVLDFKFKMHTIYLTLFNQITKEEKIIKYNYKIQQYLKQVKYNKNNTQIKFMIFSNGIHQQFIDMNNQICVYSIRAQKQEQIGPYQNIISLQTQNQYILEDNQYFTLFQIKEISFEQKIKNLIKEQRLIETIQLIIFHKKIFIKKKLNNQKLFIQINELIIEYFSQNQFIKTKYIQILFDYFIIFNQIITIDNLINYQCHQKGLNKILFWNIDKLLQIKNISFSLLNYLIKLSLIKDLKQQIFSILINKALIQEIDLENYLFYAKVINKPYLIVLFNLFNNDQVSLKNELYLQQIQEIFSNQQSIYEMFLLFAIIKEKKFKNKLIQQSQKSLNYLCLKLSLVLYHLNQDKYYYIIVDLILKQFIIDRNQQQEFNYIRFYFSNQILKPLIEQCFPQLLALFQIIQYLDIQQYNKSYIKILLHYLITYLIIKTSKKNITIYHYQQLLLSFKTLIDFKNKLSFNLHFIIQILYFVYKLILRQEQFYEEIFQLVIILFDLKCVDQKDQYQFLQKLLLEKILQQNNNNAYLKILEKIFSDTNAINNIKTIQQFFTNDYLVEFLSEYTINQLLVKQLLTEKNIKFLMQNRWSLIWKYFNNSPQIYEYLAKNGLNFEAILIKNYPYHLLNQTIYQNNSSLIKDDKFNFIVTILHQQIQKDKKTVLNIIIYINHNKINLSQKLDQILISLLMKSIQLNLFNSSELINILQQLDSLCNNKINKKIVQKLSQFLTHLFINQILQDQKLKDTLIQELPLQNIFSRHIYKELNNSLLISKQIIDLVYSSNQSLLFKAQSQKQNLINKGYLNSANEPLLNFPSKDFQETYQKWLQIENI